MTIQDEITAQTLKTVKQAQDITIDAINTVAERVSPLLAKLPTVPALENLPKPVEIVENAFSVSELLLTSAKNVAVTATKAFAPEAPKPAKKAPVTKKTVATASAE